MRRRSSAPDWCGMVGEWHIQDHGSQTLPLDLYFKAESREEFSNELPSSFW